MEDVEMLKAFLEALKIKGIPYNTKRFDSRLKIQKMVYIGQFFNISGLNNYEFNKYLHGPYSEKLAEDYYTIDNIKADPQKIEKFLNDKNFQKFVKLVKGKNGKWLAVAAEIIDVKLSLKSPPPKIRELFDEIKIIETVSERKLVPKSYVKSVLNELSNLEQFRKIF